MCNKKSLISRLSPIDCLANCNTVDTVHINMPKAPKKGSHSGQTPYAKGGAGASSKLANNVFKMNKDLGQHILKNPGVAQAIVDKAGLKQSDVCRRLL